MRPAESYNRSVNAQSVAAAAVVVFIALLSGCKHDIQNSDAVRQGVLNYLAKRSDLLSMDVSVTKIDYRQNQAVATVRFQAKGNTAPGSGLTMQYVLDRKGNLWVVRGRSGADAHGSQSTGMPPQEDSGSGSIGAMPGTAMPPGHPSVGSGAASGTLPPGHPPVDPGKNAGKSK